MVKKSEKQSKNVQAQFKFLKERAEPHEPTKAEVLP